MVAGIKQNALLVLNELFQSDLVGGLVSAMRVPVATTSFSVTRNSDGTRHLCFLTRCGLVQCMTIVNAWMADRHLTCAVLQFHDMQWLEVCKPQSCSGTESRKLCHDRL